MACSTYIFCLAKAEKEMASEFEKYLSFSFFLAAAVFDLIETKSSLI